VQDVDDTEEARESYKADKTTMYKDPDGNLHSPWTKEGHAKSEFYRDLHQKKKKNGKKRDILTYLVHLKTGVTVGDIETELSVSLRAGKK